MAIESIEELRAHVALATRVELSTIPAYLYAMYSIKDQHSVPARLIAGIAVEEMLHVCLTTNLLLAIGGEPDFGRDVYPVYPGLLAHHKPDLRLELKACSLAVVRELFMGIERPQPTDALPEDEDFETLGQFYAALSSALDWLNDRYDLFVDPQVDRQLSNPAFYGPIDFDAEDSGGLMLITDRTSAHEALEIVIHQGEGVGHERWADPAHLELTHYFKFAQLASEWIEIGPVWPVLDNPRTADLPASIQPVSHLFNCFYRLTLLTMERLFSGYSDQDAGIDGLYLLMSHCLAPTARYLVTLPVSDSHHAGPSFEYVEFEGDPWHDTAQLAADVAIEHPDLADVALRLRDWL